jgi:hypothetical protein
MKQKAKIVVITGISFMLLGGMQVATASTEEVVGTTVLELTDGNMDVITAGSKSSASSRASARGRSTSARTRTNTRANRYTNYGVSSGVATSCCDGGYTSTRASASASGDVVRTRGGHRHGRGYSASWAAAYGRRR